MSKLEFYILFNSSYTGICPQFSHLWELNPHRRSRQGEIDKDIDPGQESLRVGLDNVSGEWRNMVG